jgi:integrase
MTKTNIQGVFKNIGKKDTTYYIRYRINDRVETEKVGKMSDGMTADQAYQILKERKTQDLRTKVEEKKSAKANNSTLQNLTKKYFKKMTTLAQEEKNLEQKDKTAKTFTNIKKEESIYRNFWSSWEYINLPLNRIKEKHIKDFLLKQREKYSHKSIYNARMLAKSIIKHTDYQGLNPFDFKDENTQKMFKHKSNARKRYLDEFDCKVLLNHFREKSTLQNYIMVLMSLTTGARPNSVISLKIEDIDFNKRELRFYDFKRKMYYSTIINKELYKLLLEITSERARSEYIFKSNVSKGKKPLSEYPREIGKELNILFNDNALEGEERVVPYTFRHTFANLLLQVHKMPIFDVSALLNHASVETTIKNYITFNNDSVAAQLEIFGEKLIS